MLLRLGAALLCGVFLDLPWCLAAWPLLCVGRPVSLRAMKGWSLPVLLALLAGAWDPMPAPPAIASGTDIEVIGWVAERPVTSHDSGMSRCLLRVEQVVLDSLGTRLPIEPGRNLLLRHRGVLPAYGCRVRCRGPVVLPRTGRHFHGWDERSHLRARQAWGTLTATSVSRLAGRRGSAWRRTLTEPLRTHLAASLRDVVTGHARGLLLALLLGIREDLDPELRDAWRALGMSHVLALSGMHVGIVAAGLLACVGGVRHRPGLVVVLLGVFGYAAVGGWGASVLRAACMVAVASLAAFLGRARRPLRALGTTACLLLALSPTRLQDLGFQLSCSATLGILVALPPLVHWATRRPSRSLVGRLFVWAVPAAAVGLAAQVTTLPWIAHHFGMVSWMSPIANLLLVPVVDVALMIGLGAALLDPVFPVVSRTLWLVAGGALHGVAVASLWCVRHIEPRVFLRSDAPVVLLAAASALCLIAALSWTGRRRRLLLGGTLLGLVGVFALGTRPDRNDWCLEALDVGQGDALLLRLGPETWLIDAGPTRPVDQGARTVVPHLQRERIGALRGVVVSHPHEDHHGGIEAVLAAIPVDTLYAATASLQHPVLQRWRDRFPQVPQRGLQQGDSLALGGPSWGRVLWPPPEDVLHSGANGVSVCLWVHSPSGPDVLFMGDLENDGEQRVLESWGEALRARRDAFLVLKAAHHGSRTSSSAAFLDAIDAEIALVSAGKRNRYGHPSLETLRALQERRCVVLRTDEGGDIRLLRHAQRVWVQRPASRRHPIGDPDLPLTTVPHPD